MLHMIVNVIGMALFIGIYAYALSTEPLPGAGENLRTGRGPRPLRSGWLIRLLAAREGVSR